MDPVWPEHDNAVIDSLNAHKAKRDELARIMSILEADFKEKNILPPRKTSSYDTRRVLTDLWQKGMNCYVN